MRHCFINIMIAACKGFTKMFLTFRGSMCKKPGTLYDLKWSFMPVGFKTVSPPQLITIVSTNYLSFTIPIFKLLSWGWLRRAEEQTKDFQIYYFELLGNTFLIKLTAWLIRFVFFSFALPLLKKRSYINFYSPQFFTDSGFCTRNCRSR